MNQNESESVNAGRDRWNRNLNAGEKSREVGLGESFARRAEDVRLFKRQREREREIKRERETRPTIKAF